MQEGSEREINICITKIFNWAYSQPKCLFDMEFYGEGSDEAIIEKSVEGTFAANSMNLNTPLKITYTSEENIVILKLSRRNPRELLGQFQINLDALALKSVQYFPFGLDYVLQVNIYISPPPFNPRASRSEANGSSLHQNSRISDVLLFDHNQYLAQRENFLGRRDPYRVALGHPPIPQPHRRGREIEPYSDERYAYQPQLQPYMPHGRLPQSYMPSQSQRSGNAGPKMKKCFSEKIFSLLQEVRSVRQDIELGQGSKGKDMHTPKIKKSMSDSRFNLNAPSGSQFPREPTKQAKRCLVLKTLDLVPSQQYFPEQQGREQRPPQFRQQQRAPDFRKQQRALEGRQLQRTQSGRGQIGREHRHPHREQIDTQYQQGQQGRGQQEQLSRGQDGRVRQKAEPGMWMKKASCMNPNYYESKLV